jgi:predicted acylesterase/phospholipase RssA
MTAPSITQALVEKYKASHTTQGNRDTTEQTAQGVWGSFKGLIGASSTGMLNWVKGGTQMDFTQREKIENLLMQKRTAISYSEWLAAGKQLDELQQFNTWKEEKESTLYDFELIEKNLNDLREARKAGDVRKLTYLIRTTWTRNIANIGNVNLYRHSHTGTKALIEEYLQECELALADVTAEGNGIDDKYVLGMLIQTRKNIGRTALVLSGGGCFGLFHIGVLAALTEGEILPRIISGSSAGAIVASVLCVHNQDEVVDLLQNIVEKNFNIFDDSTKKEGFLKCLSRFLKYGTWFDSDNLKRTMIDFLGDLTFREAYYRTGKILNITVSPASVHEHPRLLNYLTAPSVLIWSAVCASCSLPGIFPSSTIYEKNPKTGLTQEWHHTSVKFVDGSVDNDLPIARLSEMFNVDHIIACQVNPHVVPFLKLSVTCVGGEIETEYSARFKTKLGQLYDIWAAEVTHYLQMAAEMSISRNLCTKLRSVLSQQYSGDITILPDLSEVARLNKLLVNPTPEYLLQATMKGARATWPKISIIRNHCGLEFALDRAINLLKSRNFKDLTSHLTLVNSPNLDGTLYDGQHLAVDSMMLKTGKKGSHPPLHHNRHRSETLTIGRLKTLRAVKSNIHVDTAVPQTPVRYNGNRNQRSYSASNEETGSFFYPQNFSLPASENGSPRSYKEVEGDFKHIMSSSSPNKKMGKPSLFMKGPGMSTRPSSSELYGKSVSVSSRPSSSELFLSPKKGKYNNIDDLDGLFAVELPLVSDESADPVKVDEFSSPSPEI